MREGPNWVHLATPWAQEQLKLNLMDYYLFLFREAWRRSGESYFFSCLCGICTPFHTCSGSLTEYCFFQNNEGIIQQGKQLSHVNWCPDVQQVLSSYSQRKG